MRTPGRKRFRILADREASPRHGSATEKSAGGPMVRLARDVAWLALLLVSVAGLHAAEPTRPNVVIIPADDMGYSDGGGYGGRERDAEFRHAGAGNYPSRGSMIDPSSSSK